MAKPSLRDVSLDAEWIPHTFDATGANLTFVRVSSEARAKLMFLSDEHFADQYAKATFPAAEVASEVAAAKRAPIHFIFHTSFCCSTLLARALEIPGISSTLREPDVLINLANRMIRNDDSANRQRLELVLRLFERTSAEGESVIVKPSNFGNRLLDVVLASRPQSRAVLLYSDVETLLRSLLKRGMFGRIFGRRLFTQLLGWAPINLGYSAEELLQLTDAQAVALAWLMQIRHFDSIVRAFGAERVLLLDSADLLADPAVALDRAQALFGLGVDNSQVQAMASGPAFSRHSKFSDREFSAEAREQEHRAVNVAHADEIDMVVQWIGAVANQVGAPLRPGS